VHRDGDSGRDTPVGADTPDVSVEVIDVGAAFELACSLHMQGQLDRAEQLYRAVLQRERTHIGTLHNLAILCFQRGCYDEAVSLSRDAVRLQPELAVAHNTLGVALRHLGRIEEAEACCHEALRCAPDYAEAHNTLGDVLMAQRRWAEAEACYRAALRMQAGYAEAYNNLGAALTALGRLDEAERCCTEALRLKPANPAALINLANALALQKKLGEAAACFGFAAALKPDDADVLFSWFHIKQTICDWSDYAADQARIQHAVRTQALQALPSAAFRLLGCATPVEDQLAFARRVAASIAVPASRMLPHRSPGRGERLRVGYLSGNFHTHPVAHLIAGLIEQHDRRRFEVIGYGFDEDDGSAMRQRLVGSFDHFVDIRRLHDHDAAQLIHADAIDILVDLHGWTPDCRAKILAYRPAPIQVNYLGYPGTSGADFIDYIVVDRFVVPPEQRHFFSEQLVYLPDCYQCNDDRRQIAERTPLRADCGLPEQGFVFCCFNNTYKITPTLFEIWMRLLRAVPRSVLWLYEANPLVKANLAREAEARGISERRLIFAPRLPQAQHLARHRLADLFLDTLPYNAHTTASDALWAGLPVLTCAGATFAGRVAGSLLRAVGLDELVTTSLEEYEAVALRFARKPEQLARLRARLAENRLSYPLFDTARYTRYLEAAFSRMVEIREAGRQSAAFSVLPSRDSDRSL
jgi:protein O-GlcNAc transferase